jgi:hypothetical protein
MKGITHDDNTVLGIRFGLLKVAFVLIACILGMWCVTHVVYAGAPTLNESYVLIGDVVGNVTALNTTEIIPVNSTAVANQTVLPESGERIMQGQCVQIGNTYDISGIGWWTGYIGYYGRYNDDFSPPNSSLVTAKALPYSIADLRAFNITPEAFGPYPGYWYVIYDKDTRGSNNRLFKVSKDCRNESGYQPVISVTPVKINATTLVSLAPLPGKFGDGIVIARGDPLYLDGFDPETRLWIFGKDLEIYDIKQSDGIVRIEPDYFNNSEDGMYDTVIESAGKNGIFEAAYDPKHQQEKSANDTYPAIVSPFISGSVINIYGKQPLVVESELKGYINRTIDDSYKSYRLDMAYPQIYVARLDATILNDNRTFMQIRGYTNLRQDTPLDVVIDALDTPSVSKTNEKFSTVVGKDSQNLAEWRQFTITVPIDYGNKFPGQHYITISSGTSAKAVAPFYVRRELPAHYQQPEYVEFVDNSPFIKPIYINTTVTVIVPGPTQYVTVTITPSEQQIRKAGEDFATPLIAGGVFLLLLAYLAYRLLKWMAWIYRRSRL